MISSTVYAENVHRNNGSACSQFLTVSPMSLSLIGQPLLIANSRNVFHFPAAVSRSPSHAAFVSAFEHKFRSNFLLVVV